MTEQNTINIDSIMEQAQVFASAWSLIDGPFDQGNALENAEEAKTELREMLEEFCSNTELQRVAELLVAWHQRNMGNIAQVLSSPADSEIHLGETNPVVLTGEKLQGFRIGLVMAKSWFEKFPLQVNEQEEDAS